MHALAIQLHKYAYRYGFVHTHIHTRTSLNPHIKRLTKHHNLLLQPKAYNSVVVSIYNGAYFFPAKTMHLYLQSCMRSTVFIFLNHLWPKNNRQIILLIQVVLLSS